jgi:outer membrane protein assembly factor BamB
MKQSEEHFSAETIDEQIEQITNKPDKHSSSVSQPIEAQNATNTQLVHDLRTLTHNDAQLLAEIRERLTHVYEESGAVKQPMQDTQNQPILFQVHAEKKHPVKRRIVQLLSGLVAALVIGSVLAVLIANSSHISHPTSPVTPPDYYSLINGHLIRVDAKSGAIRWEYTINQMPNQIAIGIPFIVKGDTVYIVNNTTEYAINNTNGSLRWSKRYANTSSQSRPIIVDNSFYIEDNNTHQVNAYTLSNAKLTQSYNVPLDKSFFTVANNVLYIWNDSTIQAIKLANQQTLWTQHFIEVEINKLLPETAFNVDINNGTCYIQISPNKQSTEKSILALNAMTGAKIGQTPLFTSPIPVFMANNDVIYYEEHNSEGPVTFHAYDAKTNKEIWHQDFNTIIDGFFSIDGKTVTIDIESNKIVTLDAASGTLKWQYSAQQIGDQDSGFMHTQAGQGQSAIYLFMSNKATTQIIIFTPEGKTFKHITIKN